MKVRRRKGEGDAGEWLAELDVERGTIDGVRPQVIPGKLGHMVLRGGIALD